MNETFDGGVDRTLPESILTYVAQYTCRNYLKKHQCEVCKLNLIGEDLQPHKESKSDSHLKANNMEDKSFFGGQCMVKPHVIKFFGNVESVVKHKLDKGVLGKNISQVIFSEVVLPSNQITLCSKSNLKMLITIYIKMRIYYHFKFRSRNLNDVDREDRIKN